jgi:hypothetical protein
MLVDNRAYGNTKNRIYCRKTGKVIYYEPTAHAFPKEGTDTIPSIEIIYAQHSLQLKRT